MSKIKNFDPAQYGSHFLAIKSFIEEGLLVNYVFPVCNKQAAHNALAYLCLNDIDHSYTCTPARKTGISLVTLTWHCDGGSDFICFWCEGEI